MTQILNELIQESSVTGAADMGRPQLLAMTHAVNALIYADLVATQSTSKSIATLFGLRYLNRDGDMSFRAPATYGGTYGDRALVDKELTADNTAFAKGDVFKFDKVIYQAIDDINMTDMGGGDDILVQLSLALMLNKVRIVSDAGETGEMEFAQPSESKLALDRWKVELRTRKLKSEVTHEFIQDIKANGFDGEKMIRDMLATEIAEEINRDVMQKLQTVSTRHNTDTTKNGIYYAGGTTDDPAKGRTMYRIVCEMARAVHSETSFEASYVLCSPRVAALLSSSGWMKGDTNMANLYSGVLSDGLKVYVDPVTRFDYVIVGTKQNTGDMENVGSLFYSPYTATDGAGQFTFAHAVEDLQPRIMAMTRYGLSVNPYTTEGEDTEQVYAGDDWNSLAGKSKYSRFCGVVF